MQAYHFVIIIELHSINITMLPSDSAKVSTPPLSISKSKDFLIIYIYKVFKRKEQ